MTRPREQRVTPHTPPLRTHRRASAAWAGSIKLSRTAESRPRGCYNNSCLLWKELPHAGDRLLDASDRRTQLTDSNAEPELDGIETEAVDLSGDLRRLMAVDREHPHAELEELLNAHWIAIHQA